MYLGCHQDHVQGLGIWGQAVRKAFGKSFANLDGGFKYLFDVFPLTWGDTPFQTAIEPEHFYVCYVCLDGR